jgi:hypothetical protein
MTPFMMRTRLFIWIRNSGHNEPWPEVESEISRRLELNDVVLDAEQLEEVKQLWMQMQRAKA